mgnify:CR=1 FL=1
MLSRIAESLYWIGRYVERAEDTARILDVHFHLLVENQATDEADSYRALLHAMGVPTELETIDGPSVAALLTHDQRFAGSIASSLGAAWDNARGAREAISSELWECLNVTHGALGAWNRDIVAPHEFLRWVKERASIAAGIIDTTMSRDEGWRFLVLGRSVERADMTVRLLSARYGERWGAAGWRVLLRCCSAHEAFLRRHHGTFDPLDALAFLVSDDDFPRSVGYSLRAAEDCLSVIEQSSARGIARQGEARRLLGRAAADLSYTSIAELAGDLDARLEHLEWVCAAAHDAITGRYFRASAPIEWSA